MQRIRI